MATQFKTVSKFIAATGVFGLAALGSVSSASAATIRLADATSLRSTAITFSEPDAAFLNPIYSIGGRTISFSGIIDNDLANPNQQFQIQKSRKSWLHKETWSHKA